MSDQLIDEYLRDLRVSAWVRRLPKTQTAALEAETRQKIAAELAAAGNRDTETVYGVLDRLGPAADIVGKEDETSPSGYRSTWTRVLEPVARLQIRLVSRGWGLAEVGALFLLIVGPYLLWWVGPIFGILLVRSYAERWTDRAQYNATVVVFGLFGVQAVLALGLFVYALLNGGALINQFQRVMDWLPPFSGSGPTLDGPLLVLKVIGSALAPAAGLISGVYLALSPRVRR